MALGPGSIAFMGFDAGDGGALMFVALEVVDSETTIFFTNREFDGAGFSGSGATWRWTTGEPVEAGTVIRVTLAGDVLTASHGWADVVGSPNGGMADSAAAVFAFLGPDADTPIVFLAAFTPTIDDFPVVPDTPTDPVPAITPDPPPSLTNVEQEPPPRHRPSGDFADYLAELNNPGIWGEGRAVEAALAETGTEFVVCFAAGTMIMTEAGPRPVETLAPGTIIRTEGHGDLALRWVGERRLDLLRHPNPHLIAPVMLTRDAIADGMPSADLLVSPDHAVLVDGALIAAHRLRNGMTIRPREDLISVTYYHLEFNRHTLVWANGVAAESYRDTGNRGFFSNGDTAETRDPGPVEALFITTDDDRIQPIWQNLRDRALTLGHHERASPVTDDPGISIWLDGQARPATRVDGATYTFMVPPNIRSIRLLSRSARPSVARPWVDDRRQLGVRVTRITIGDGEAVCDVPLDHPALRDGWWGAERRGRDITRWTDGDAALALPPCPTAMILRIRLTGQPFYPLGALETLWPEASGQRGIWG
jgi:hypothetical protein